MEGGCANLAGVKSGSKTWSGPTLCTPGGYMGVFWK